MIKKLFLMTLLAFWGWLGQAQSDLEKASGGADEIEGWIIKKTDKGIIKIPKKQKFKFDGTSLEADASAPPATVLQPRLTPNRKSLIPVRTSFRNEFYDSVGVARKDNRKDLR
jgi:hypothetical protein